ncbi:S8 family serine peptidase [Intrasporangium sp. YIM S08009]|uniref:S8 family serine peptidase n=1 Tax=Intrasporangium zincisolvens TaxID=3080018 RepID=UPI002B05A81E|nr:S8 family serine peptidase [Intrasporangium sp. YIM S08009]
MSRRRPLATALTLALVAPVSALTASAATAAPTHPSTSATAVPAPVAPAAPATSSSGAKRLPRPVPAKGAQRAHDPHTVLVRFKPTASTAIRDHAVKRRGASLRDTLKGTSFTKVHTTGSAEALARSLSADPSVADVSLDYVRKASATPNDPEYPYGGQAYLRTLRMPTAWDRSKGSLNTVVAVVDSGVDGRHSDLTGRTVAGWNALTNTAIPAGASSDDYWHGTMVAGIIAAETNNGDGIAGVAWNARVMPVKVLDSFGSGNDSDVIEGMTWAVDHGARIINLSLGGDGDSPALHDAVRYAVGKGAVVVAAAGNDGDDVPQYPAAYSEAIAVSATDTAGSLTDFSSHGSWVDVAAPGFGIESTAMGGGYAIADGTSFSAPITAGVVALMRTQTPSLTPAQVLARLRSTARDAGPRGIDPYYGAGLVDATNALGGGWAADLAQPSAGADEPNDTPTRAIALTGTLSGSIGVEGDADWYRYDASTTQPVTVAVKPAGLNTNLSSNLDPVVTVYDQNLREVTVNDHRGPGVSEVAGFTPQMGASYIKVTNYNGARDARPYTVTVTPRPGALLEAPTWKHQPTPQDGSTVVADVTSDGRADLVAIVDAVNDDGAVPHGVIVYAQTPTGDLDDGTFYSVRDEGQPRRLAAVDEDGDGRLDLLVATFAGLQVLRQGADGTLKSAQYLAQLAGTQVGLVAAGDLNSDGLPDLTATMNATLSVRIRNPDGTYTEAIRDRTTAYCDTAIGDVDGDGRVDVVGTAGGDLRVMHNGAEGWQLVVPFPGGATGTTEGVCDVEVVDVNGDGRNDVVGLHPGWLATDPTSSVYTWLQAADGTLEPPTRTGLPANALSLEAANLTGDGRPDLVTLHTGSAPLMATLAGKGDGTWDAPVTTTLNDAGDIDGGGLSVGDLDGDGRPDAAAMTPNGVAVLRNATAPTTSVQPPLWVRSTWPADFGSGLPITTAPTVTFVRDAVPSTVSASTVRLVNGRTGAAVPATVSYDAAKRTATVKPSTALYDWAPYRLNVSGVKDTSGASMTTAYSSTFRTADTAPPAVGAFKATGALRAATLTWNAPHVNDLDRYIVRMAAGTTPPANIYAGTSAYSGTATKATVSLAQGTTYTFRIWVKDRTGHYSAGSWARVVGTAESITSNVTTVRKGYAVTLSGRIVRKDTGKGVGGAAMQLYWRRVGTSTWTLTTTRTSSSTGAFSYAHKPTASVDYMWVYRGSSALVGSSSALRRVTVR